MANKDLVAYIRRARDQKIPDSTIKYKLVYENNWTEMEVCEAMIDPASLSPKNYIHPESNIHIPKKLFLGLGIFFLLTTSGVAAMIIFKSPKQNTTVKTSPTPQPDHSVEVQPTAFIPSIPPITNIKPPPLVYMRMNSLKKTPGDPDEIVFYDLNTQKPLPVFDELDKSNTPYIEMGRYSPDGRYLPLKVVPHKDDTASPTHIYLYDASNHTLKLIYSSSTSDYKKPDIFKYAYFYHRTYWIGNDRFVIHRAVDSTTKQITVWSIDLQGKIYEELRHPVSKWENQNLSYIIRHTFGLPDIYENFTIYAAAIDYSTTDEVIGLSDSLIVALHRPNTILIDDHTYLAFYDYSPDTKKEIKRVSIRDGNWHTFSALISTDGQKIYVHQIDSEKSPQNERILTIDIETEEKIILFERRATSHAYANAAIKMDKVSFYVSNDAKWLISYHEMSRKDRDTTSLPYTSDITITNLQTHETSNLCDDVCLTARIYSPNLLWPIID